MKVLLYCWVFVGLLGANGALGQATSVDSVFVAAAIQQLTNRYTAATESEWHLYNGKEYLDYDKYYLRGHQFFKSAEEQAGSIYYDNYLYPAVPLRYDVLLDQLVLSPPESSLLFKLANDKVSYFNVHGHSFIRLVVDTLAQSAIRPGFYDLLVDGKTQVLAKRSKRIQEQATSRGMEGDFLVTDKFFIRKNDAYYPVNLKKSVLALFPAKKKELQKYIRSQRLKFRKTGRETALIKLVHYYNTLPPE